MTKLSVNINKFALLRNARGTNLPDLVEVADKCMNFGAQGITIHPRPDERHIKFSDLPLISKIVNSHSKTELNIEGYPSQKFINEVININPKQVTLVPDPPDALTSSFGWNCKEHNIFLKDVVKEFKSNNIRVSLFVSPSTYTLEHLSEIQPDRVELYTFDYAKNYSTDKTSSIKPYKEVVSYLKKHSPNIQLNAGHDLNLNNLGFILKEISNIKEVSIGHALVCDAFTFGLEETIKKYLKITSSN